MRQIITKPSKQSVSAGFTLIEVLLVVMLTSMLMYGMGEIFKLSSDVVGVSEAEVEVRQKARVIFGRMEMDLQSLVLDSKGNYFRIWRGTGRAIEGVPRMDDKLRLVTSVKYNPEGLPGRFDVTRVLYRLLPEGESLNLLAEKKIMSKKQTSCDEAPLLVRYSLTTTTEEMAMAFQRKHRTLDRIKESKPKMDADPQTAAASYKDIISERVLDFGVERLNSNKLENLSDVTLYSLDSYWLHTPCKTDEEHMVPPLCLRISITLHDNKSVIERSFENIIPMKVSFKQAPQGGNTP